MDSLNDTRLLVPFLVVLLIGGIVGVLFFPRPNPSQELKVTAFTTDSGCAATANATVTSLGINNGWRYLNVTGRMPVPLSPRSYRYDPQLIPTGNDTIILLISRHDTGHAAAESSCVNANTGNPVPAATHYNTTIRISTNDTELIIQHNGHHITTKHFAAIHQ